MPRIEFFHKGGQPVSGEIKHLLERYFSEEEVRKIERLGGRLLLSLSIPYHENKKKRGKNFDLNDHFVDMLRSVKDNKTELEDNLSELTVRQLRELGRLIGCPLRTKSSRQEIINELMSSFAGDDLWRGIADFGNIKKNPANKA